MKASDPLYLLDGYTFTRLRRRARSWHACLAAGALLLSGCQILPEAQPDPTRFFVLNAPVLPAPAVTHQEDGLAIGFNGVDLPAYLRNSRSMIVARGDNELVYRDFDRWAEPLDDGLTRVMREALLAHERIARVETFPFTGNHTRDFDITLRVLRCEGAETDEDRKVARLIVAYEITEAGAAARRVAEGRFAATERPWNGEADALATALGAAAVETANAIADALPR